MGERFGGFDSRSRDVAPVRAAGASPIHGRVRKLGVDLGRQVIARWALPRPVRRIASAALLVAVAASPLRAGLPGSWKEIRSAHFVVIGNEAEGKLRKIAAHFEQVRTLFERVIPKPAAAGGLPLLVLVARDAQTLQTLVPATVAANGNANNVGGVFYWRPTMELIVVRSDSDLDSSLQIVNHEYFHYLVKSAGLRLPLWINEGLADFWSTAKFKDDSTEVGRPLSHRLSPLREARRIPFERLMRVNGLSPEYRRPGLKPLLYGEAWAIVHYAMLGDESGERTKQLSRYLAAVTQGEESLAAARAAFGDLDALEKKVDGYARRKLFKFASSAAVPAPPEASLAARSLADAEAAATIALAQLHVDRLATAEPQIQAALAGAADLPATRIVSGLVGLARRELDAAAQAFELASATPGAGPMAPYGAAVTAIARESSNVDLARVEQYLLQALAADARFVPAYSRLADVYLRRPGDERRALAMIRRAQALSPEDEVFELREAQILARLGDAAGARSAIDEVVDSALESENWAYQNNICWHGALAGFANEVLRVCDLAVRGSAGASSVRDSRGVARAIAGDLAGAADDFREVVRAKERQNQKEFLARRSGWLAALESGTNPLTPAELQALLDSPTDSALWGT